MRSDVHPPGLCQCALAILLLCLASVVCAQPSLDDPLRPLSPALKAIQAQLHSEPNRAESWAIPPGHSADAVMLRVLLANAERRRARVPQALKLLTDADAMARELESPEPLLATLETLATTYLDNVQFEACDAAIARLQTLAEQRGLAVWHGRALGLRGGYWRRRGDYEKALAAHVAALDLRERSGDRFGEVESINAIALLRRRGGELYQALDGHTKALRIATEIGYRSAGAESRRLIARIYNELDDFEQAERFYAAALADVDPHDEVARADILLELASVVAQLGRLDEGERLADDAIELGQRTQGENYSGIGFMRRAQILSLRGQPAEALHWIDESLRLGRNFDGARSILVKRAARLRTLQALKRHDEAVDEGEFVLQMAREVGDRLVERDALKLYAEALSGSGKPEAAFEAMALYSKINAEVASSMTSRRIADLESSLKRRELESNLALAEKDRDLSRLQSERQRWILFGAAALGVALIAALLTLIARIRRVRAVNQLLHHQSELLKRASETDALTGLPNRRGAVHAYQNMAAAGGERLVVMLLDIDHFKRINDRYGHAGGDDVLKEIADRLRRVTPPSFCAARWGGEEFLLIGALSTTNTETTTRQLADAVLDAIRSEPMSAAGSSLTVTTSIGVAIGDTSGATGGKRWESLLQAADVALYQAKVSGRDQVVVATGTAKP